MDKKIKIVIADDHEVVIDGLIALLSLEPGILVVGKALDGEQLLEVIRNKAVDIIILDIEMPRMDGLDTTREIKMQYPEIKILILTMYNTPEFIAQLAKMGVDGYILKNSSKRVLTEAIYTVANNGKFFPPEIKDKLFEMVLPHPGKAFGKPELTDREKEIIILIASELTTQEIADKLFLSFHTIEKHRKNIMAKLQVKNTAGLVKYAIRMGWVA